MENNNFQKSILAWLTPQLFRIKTKGLKVWLIGSVASGNPKPKDCDLLLIAPLSELELIIEHTDFLRNNFRLNFELPLHLTIISTEELKDSQEFLSKVFHTKIFRIKPTLVKIEDG